MAGPRSDSSIILWLVSSRTLLIRVFHGVNCESVAPAVPERRTRTSQPPTVPGNLGICPRSAGAPVIADPREGAASKMQAISVNIADRPAIIRDAPQSERFTRAIYAQRRKNVL